MGEIKLNQIEIQQPKPAVQVLIVQKASFITWKPFGSPAARQLSNLQVQFDVLWNDNVLEENSMARLTGE